MNKFLTAAMAAVMATTAVGAAGAASAQYSRAGHDAAPDAGSDIGSRADHDDRSDDPDAVHSGGRYAIGRRVMTSATIAKTNAITPAGSRPSAAITPRAMSPRAAMRPVVGAMASGCPPTTAPITMW